MQKYLYLFLLPLYIFSQERKDSIVSDTVLHVYLNEQFSAGHMVEKIALDDPKSNGFTFIGQALQNNSSISFREQTYGNISSISFRGLSPNHTGVYWEGIPINSSFLGQIDFNTISTGSFSDVSFRKGGGSALYGSGAVGGSFFLNRALQYNKGFGLGIKQFAGSFGQNVSNLDLSYSDEKTSVKISGNYNASENNYLIDNGVSVIPQENAAYSLWTANADIGYKLDRKNDFKLSLWSNNNGFRQFPGNRFATQNSQLQNYQQLTSLKWTHKQKNVTHFSQLAYLGEEFVYQANKNVEVLSVSQANSFIARYDAILNPIKKYKFRLGTVANHIIGNGDNYPNSGVNRTDLLYYFSASRKMGDLSANLNVNKGFTSSQFTIPFTFDLGFDYTLNTKHKLKASINTNQRIPTLNDLFYQPGGNPNIKAESGWSGEFSHLLTLNKSFNTTMSVYYGEFSNFIQWEPNISGIFSPFNFNEVHNYGFEAFAEYQKRIGSVLLKWIGNYAFTRSIDQENNKQRRYVPFHKANQSLVLGYRNLGIHYNWLLNGATYVDGFELESIDGFQLHNLIFVYKIPNKNLDTEIQLTINNILDESYETLRFNPMPGRNYLAGIKLKL